jgi:hypothetical protein
MYELPTINSPITASKEKINEALALLSTLKMRQPETKTRMKLMRAAYGIALDGVPAEVLEIAVRAILQDSLKHPFVPSPPELRGECDRVFFALKLDMLTRRLVETMPTDEQVVEYLRRQHLRVIEGGGQ